VQNEEIVSRYGLNLRIDYSKQAVADSLRWVDLRLMKWSGLCELLTVISQMFTQGLGPDKVTSTYIQGRCSASQRKLYHKELY
jgi:hypothetical protein